MAGKKIAEYTVGVGFQVDSKGLQQAFKEIQNINFPQMKALNPNIDESKIKAAFDRIRAEANGVENALIQSFNPKLNTYSFDKFNALLKQSHIELDTVIQDFKMAGITGQNALMQIGKTLTTTNVELKQTHTWLEKMGTTIANTVRWQVATKVIQGMTGSIQSAIYFTKDLDKSLNDIRIVTDKSAESMNRFAQQAVTAAKTLGKSTTDYTNASLIFYQQGLGDEEVAARTATTLKASNVTGQSASAVSQELTAVWNGYQIQVEDTEEAVDKLAAVAATSASNLEELSTAMSKVAATANMTGVDIDQLNAQISTIISVTRQAPETVGTALKTIYARISDLKLGGTDEDGIGLGQVSSALHNIGIEVLDSTGDLRDMGTVIEEIAEKWNYLTRAERTALAEVMGGKRQYTNLVALFDNWDKYNKALETSRNSLGTLQKQQDTYMDSIKAIQNQVATAKEELYMTIMDSDTIYDVNKGLLSVLESITKIVKALGGGKALLTQTIAIVSTALTGPLSKAFSTTVQNIGASIGNKRAINQIEQNAKQYGARLQAQGLGESEANNYTQNRAQNFINFREGYITKEELDRLNQGLDEVAKTSAKWGYIQENNNQIQSAFNTILKENSQEAQFNTESMQANKAELDKIILARQAEHAALGDVSTILDKYSSDNKAVIAANESLVELDEKLTDSSKEKIEEYKKEIEQIKLEEQALNNLIEAQKEYDKKNHKTGAYTDREKAFHAITGRYTTPGKKASAEQVKNTIDKEKQRIDEKKVHLNREIKNSQEESTKAVKNAAEAENQLNRYRSEAEVRMNKQIQLQDQLRSSQNAEIQNVTQGLSSLAIGTASAIISIDNLSNSFSALLNKELSLKDFLKTAVIMFPMLLGQINNVTNGISKLLNITNLHNATKRVSNDLDKASAAVKELDGKATTDQTIAEESNVGATQGATESKVQETVVTDADSASKEINTKITWKAVAASVAWKIAIVAAAAAIVYLIAKQKQRAAALQKEREEQAKAAKDAADSAQKNIDATLEESKAIDSLIEKYKELNEEYADRSLQEKQYAVYNILREAGKEKEAIQALTASYQELDAIMERIQRQNNNNVIKNTEKEIKNVKKGIEGIILDSDTVGNKIDIAKASSTDTIITNENFQADKIITSDTAYDFVKQIEKQLGLDITAVKTHNQWSQENAELLDKSTGTEYLDFSELYKPENYEILKDNIDAIIDIIESTESSTETYSTTANVFYKIKENIDQISSDLDEVNQAKLDNKVMDLFGYGFKNYDSQKIDASVTQLSNFLVDELEYTADKAKDTIIDIFAQNGKLRDVEVYYLKQTKKYNKDFEKLSDNQVKELYRLYQNYGENIADDLIEKIKNDADRDSALASKINTAIKTIDEIYQNSGNEFTDTDYDTIMGTDMFQTWLEQNNKNITDLAEGQKGIIVSEFANYLNTQGDEIQQQLQGSADKYKTDYLDKYEEELGKAIENSKIPKILQGKFKEAIMSGDESFLSTIYETFKDSFSDDINTAVNSYQEANKKYQELTKAAKEFKELSTKEAFAIQVSNFKTLNSELDKIQSGYSTLTSALESYNETGGFTLDQVQSLVNLDPMLLNALYNEAGELELNEKGLERLTQAYLNYTKASIIQQGEKRAELIIDGQMDEATVMLWESQLNLNDAMAGMPLEESAARIKQYTQNLLNSHQDIDEVTKRRLAENEEYTINQLRTVDKLHTDFSYAMTGSSKALEKSKNLVEAELDIYHDINIELKKIEREIDRINDKREKLLGQDLYNSYSQELAALEAQEDALKRLQDLQKKDAADKRAELAANGVMFDANGEVSNYNAIKQKWADQVNANPDNEALSKRRDELEELLSGYEELWDEKIPDTVDKLTDVANAKIEAAVNRFNLHMDVTLDLTEMKRAFNEFRRDFIDKTRSDDFSKFIETLTENMKLSYKAMDENVKHVNEIQAEIEKIRAGKNSDIYGDNLAKAVEDLENYNEKLKDEMKSVTEDLTSANEKYAESIDKLTEAYAKQQEYLEKLSQNYEDNAKLMQLLYGENNSSVAGLLDQQANTLALSAQKYKAEADRYEVEIAKIQARLADSSLTTETRQALEEEFQTLQDASLEAINNAAAASVAAIEKANEAFEATVKGNTYDMASKLLGSDFDTFKANWEATQHYAELYYDDINKSFEVQKLMNKYQKTLNDLTGTAQAKLREAYDAELKHLKEKDKLTKYDIERAQKKYDLLVAQIALEEAQQNKNTLQLVRDSQGNYNYQYTADASAVSDAQEKVDNLQQELYNLDQEAWKENTEAIMSETETISDKVTESYVRQNQQIKKVQDNENLSEEEKLKKIAEITDAETNIRQKYYDKLNALTRERVDIAKHAEEDTKDIVEDYAIELEDNYMPRLFATWEDTNNLIGEDGERVAELINQSQQTISDKNDVVTKLIADNGTKAADAYQKIDDKIQKVLIPTQDAYIKKMDEEVTETDKVAKAIEELAQSYQKLYGDAGTAAEKTANLIELCKDFQKLQDKTVTYTVNYKVTGNPEAANGMQGDFGNGGEKTPPSSDDEKSKGIDFDFSTLKGSDTKSVSASRSVANDSAATHSILPLYGETFAYDLGADSFTYGQVQKAASGVKELTEFINQRQSEYVPIYNSKGEKGYIGWGSFVKTFMNKLFIRKSDPRFFDLYSAYGGGLYGSGQEDHAENAASLKKRWSNEVAKNILYFRSGGYTGDWGDSGKLAVLHQKELVLNSVDTANLLETIKYQREISQMQMAAAATSEKTPSTMTANGQLDQNVYIEASFPGVQNANEIEAALNNLVNAAAQRANSNLL